MDGTSRPNIVNNRLVKTIIVIVAQSDFRTNALVRVFIQLDSISLQLVAISPSMVI